MSFVSQHNGKRPFDIININGKDQILLPDHCIQNTKGAELSEKLDLGKIKGNSYIFKKGINPNINSYSAFYDDERNSTGLFEFLSKKNAEELFIVGLSFDYFISNTIIDASILGFDTHIIENAIRPSWELKKN